MTTYICVMIRNRLADKDWGTAVGYPINEHYTALEAWKEANEYIEHYKKVSDKLEFKIDMREW